jgi:hypothetical protein
MTRQHHLFESKTPATATAPDGVGVVFDQTGIELPGLELPGDILPVDQLLKEV